MVFCWAENKSIKTCSGTNGKKKLSRNTKKVKVRSTCFISQARMGKDKERVEKEVRKKKRDIQRSKGQKDHDNQI